MKPSGIIYQKRKTRRQGSVRISMSWHEKFLFRMARNIGAVLVSFTLLSLLFTYSPVLAEELKYYFFGTKNTNESRFASLIDIEAQDSIKVQDEASLLNINSYFSLYIPKINAASNVIANVNANSESDYSVALEKGIAHARGSFFPGQGRQIYLFSHSTDSPINIARYNAVFYLLKKLEKGDKIIVYFSDKKYIYEVSDKLVVNKDDTSWINEDKNEEVLILQTCDPPGTTWKRLLILAKPVK